MERIEQLMKLLNRSAVVLIALVFLTDGLGKLMDTESIAVLIEGYGFIPEPWLMPIAILLPFFEVMATFGLFFNKPWAIFSIGVVSMLFIVIFAYGIWLGLDVDCGCFGSGEPELEAYSGLRSALVKNIFLLLTTGYLTYRHWQKQCSLEPLQ